MQKNIRMLPFYSYFLFIISLLFESRPLLIILFIILVKKSHFKLSSSICDESLYFLVIFQNTISEYPIKNSKANTDYLSREGGDIDEKLLILAKYNQKKSDKKTHHCAFQIGLFVIHAQDTKESFLWHFNITDGFHTFFPFFLFLKEFTFP